MRNPWLDIPLTDYEGHMSLPLVDQARFLADRFEELVERYVPNSIAIIGCAGGNGLQRISPDQVGRVVALDINPDYVAQTLRRHGVRLRNLEGCVANIEVEREYFEPVAFLYCALILEHVDSRSALRTMRHLCSPAGVMVVILQGEPRQDSVVTPSQFNSLKALSETMKTVDPIGLCRDAEANGFRLEVSEETTLASGRSFQTLVFRRSS